MRLEPGMALQPINIAIKACQEVQREPQIDDGRGWAFRTSRFFAGRGLLTTRCWGARVGAAGPPPGCSHAVFLLRHCGHLSHLAYATAIPAHSLGALCDPWQWRVYTAFRLSSAIS